MIMKNSFLTKLTSRKFIITAITAIAGIVTLFVGDNEIVQIIASAAMVVVPTIVYCITEGVIDAASVKTITETVADTAEKLGASENKVAAIEQIGAVGEVLVEETTEE
jgi:hypothetical protein